MGETRVDLQHLLEDLRDAYTGALEETILTEAVANALDSGATLISLRTDAANGTLTIVDDGRGMQRRELARYHDVAASSKARGEGIGFAGVGIKLPRASGEQYKAVRKVVPSQALPGDLIFYGPEGSQSVAMFLGGGRMLEATDPAVTVSPVRTAGMTPYLGRVIE